MANKGFLTCFCVLFLCALASGHRDLNADDMKNTVRGSGGKCGDNVYWTLREGTLSSITVTKELSQMVK